jgi:hypothetical protein
MLKKEEIYKISEGWTGNLLKKYKVQFKDFFIKLKEQFKHNVKLRDIYLAYNKSGMLTSEQASILKEIVSDNLKMVGLGGIAMLPGGSLLMIFLIKSAKKFGIDIIPSKFHKEPIEENKEEKL